MSEYKQKKKICFFSGDITRSGGTERAAVMIAGYLEKRGFEVMILSIVRQNEQMFFELPKNIQCYVLSASKKWKKPGPGYIPLVPKLRRFLKEHRPEIVIDVDTILDILTVPASVGLPIKLVAWEHFGYAQPWPFPYKIIRMYMSRFTAKHADNIVMLTKRGMDYCMQHLGRRDRISVIPNPMLFSHEDWRRPREKMLVTAGRLTHVKGIDFLGELAPRILDSHKDWKWYVLGEGEERAFLENIRDKYGLEGRLILTGNVSDVEPYLLRASVYVMTSRAEGLPMCLLEAAGCGTVSVSFDIPTGPAEIIDDGVNGFLVSPFDIEEMEKKIEVLMDNEELREEFCKNTAQIREKYKAECIIRLWEKLLLNL